MRVLVQPPVTAGQLMRAVKILGEGEYFMCSHSTFYQNSSRSSLVYLARSIERVVGISVDLIDSCTILDIINSFFSELDTVLTLIASERLRDINIGGLITESITRGRLWKVYFRYKRAQRFIRFCYRLRGTWLFLAYVAWIKRVKADCVVVSHSNYLCYGLLDRVAKYYGLKSHVISPHRTSWVCDIEGQHHVQAIIKRIGDSNDETILSQKDNGLIYNDLNSFRPASHILNMHIDDDYSRGKDSEVAFLVAFHVLRDMNYTLEGDRLFDNYFEWLCFTLDVLKKFGRHRVLLCMHPCHDGYGEREFVREFIEKYSKNGKMQILERGTLESIQKRVLPIVITCGGSIASEAVGAGLKAVTCEDTVVSSRQTVRVNSLEEYRDVLSRRYSNEEWREIFTQPADKKIQRINANVHNMGKPRVEEYRSMYIVDKFSQDGMVSSDELDVEVSKFFSAEGGFAKEGCEFTLYSLSTSSIVDFGEVRQEADIALWGRVTKNSRRV